MNSTATTFRAWRAARSCRRGSRTSHTRRFGVVTTTATCRSRCGDCCVTRTYACTRARRLPGTDEDGGGDFRWFSFSVVCPSSYSFGTWSKIWRDQMIWHSSVFCKMEDTELMAVTLSALNRFSNSSTDRFSSKKILRHVERVLLRFGFCEFVPYANCSA